MAKMNILDEPESTTFITESTGDVSYSISAETNIIYDWGDGTYDDILSGEWADHTYTDNLPEHIIKVLADGVDVIDCYDEYLISLDVTKNTKLIYLECDYTLISTINLSKNTLLDYLDISDNYEIDILDLSNNPNLTYLEAEYSAFSSIILYNNLLLDEIDISDNYVLSTIDLSQAPNLTYIEADYSAISTIDVSNNPLLVSFDVSDARISDQSIIDKILFDLDQNGLEDGYIDLGDDLNNSPSSTGLTYVSNLESKGWSVYVSDGVNFPTGLEKTTFVTVSQDSVSLTIESNTDSI